MGSYSKQEIVEIDGRELSVSLDVLDDHNGRGEDIARLVEVVGHGRGDSRGLQYLQEVEFIGCYVGVALYVCGTVLAHYEFLVEAVGPLDLEGSDAGGDATCQNPRVEEAALGVDSEDELFELRVVVGFGHWVYTDAVGLVTAGTMIA
jgi:hypothetical protein